MSFVPFRVRLVSPNALSLARQPPRWPRRFFAIGAGVSLAVWTAVGALPPDLQQDPKVHEAIEAETRGEAARALKLFLQADAAHPRHAYLLQEISQQYSDLSEDAATPEEKLQLCATALAFASRALALEPNNAVNVTAMAICYGKLALLGNTRTKVEDTRQVKLYAERALALDPHDALAHFVLGRWHYEVVQHSRTARFFAGVFYGQLPPASLAEAVRELRRATELDPTSPLYFAELGFALRDNGESGAARAAWARALALKADDRYESEAQKRATEALAAKK